MKAVLAQMRVVSGDIERNISVMKDMISQAKKDQADLIVFPEMCISGYCLKDKWLNHTLCESLMQLNEEIKELSDNIGIIWGNVYYPNNGKFTNRDGSHLRMNACYFAYNQKWVRQENTEFEGVYFKHLTPDYRFFDDSRYFLSGVQLTRHLRLNESDLISPFIWKHKDKILRVGLEVCEDLWSESYALKVSKEYKEKEVDFIVNISCSPWTVSKEKARRKTIKNQVKSKLIYVNAVGMQNTGKNVLVFDGDSAIYDENAVRIDGCNDGFNQEYKVVDFNEIKKETPVSYKLLEGLLCGIKCFDEEMFNSKVKWIIGLSGGLDSSVSATLLSLALESNRLVGYNMASQYNSCLTISNANKMADILGIKCHNGSIEKVTKATHATLKEFGYTKEYSDLVYENIQARVRGHLLSSFASIEGGVVVNNGNKVEVALGYCTLYGDSIGAISLIGDLTKKDLFELSYAINEKYQKELIPFNLLPVFNKGNLFFEMPPSAELKNAQTDPMKWYYHDLLLERILQDHTVEFLLEEYLNETVDAEMMKWMCYYGLDDPKRFIEDLEWFISTLEKNVFKRIQLPPSITISKCGFGDDYRESQIKWIQTQTYRDLKESILRK